MREIVGAAGFDKVLETTGVRSVIELAYEMTHADGTCVLVGVPTESVTIYTLPLHFKKVLTGSHGGDCVPDVDIPRIVKLNRAGRMSFDGLITHEFPLEEMGEGDLYIMNDPYHGGTHLPDIAVVMPVFHEGRAVAYAAAMTHHQDVGGMSPGSVPPVATEIYQEGIRIPPLKLREGGVLNATLMRMLELNVRVPKTFLGDLGAQIAACTVGARRVGEVAARHGHNRTRALKLSDKKKTNG